jgi:hypothetical protein
VHYSNTVSAFIKRHMYIILEQALFKDVTMEMKMDALFKHCFSDLVLNILMVYLKESFPLT